MRTRRFLNAAQPLALHDLQSLSCGQLEHHDPAGSKDTAIVGNFAL